MGGREPDISASSIFGFWLSVGAISVTLPNEKPVRIIVVGLQFGPQSPTKYGQDERD